MTVDYKKIFRNAGIGVAALAAVAVVADGTTRTGPDEVKMTLLFGDPSGFQSQGLDFKWPIVERTFSATTSLQEYQIPPSSVGLQNGTITAEDIRSSAFIQFNGSREDREQTLILIRERMPDYEARIRSLAETALRNTVRQTYVASASEGEEQTVTNRVQGIDFLDTERVGDLVARRLQNSISAIIPGTVNDPVRGEVPRIEVAEYRIGNFEWDNDYLQRRNQIADARANAEAARFQEAEAERQANAEIRRAEGNKQAEILRGEGEAARILSVRTAEAEGLEKLVRAAGGPEALREQTLAEAWNGQTPAVVGGDNVIVDSRYAPGSDVTAPVTAAPRP